jgi:hypothetical protein
MGEEYVCALRARLIVPPDSQDNFHRVVRIVATFFFFKMACNDLGMTVRCRWFFFLFLPLLSLLPLKIALVILNFRVILLFIEMSITVHLVLISNLYSWSFCKILVCFRFHHSILICDTSFFFKFVPYSFDFF